MRTWGQAADEISRRAAAVVKRLATETDQEVRARTARVAAIQSALASARGEARARLQRELAVATRELEAGRRAQRHAKEAERRMRTLERRMRESVNGRVPAATRDLAHKLSSLEAYSAAKTPSSSGGGGARLSPAQSYLQLAKMVGVAVASNAEELVAQTGEQTTAALPDPAGKVLDVAIPIAHEIRSNWMTYRLTPEFMSSHFHDLVRHR